MRFGASLVFAAGLIAYMPASAQSADGPLGATVGSLLAAGRQLSPTLRAAALETVAAGAKAKGAGALDDPTISDSYQYYKDPGVFSAHTVMLSQSFPLWGKRDLRRQAALADVDAARGQQRAAQDELDEKIKIAYAQYYLTNRDIAVNREIGELARRMRAAASARYGQGGGDQTSVIQAQSEETTAKTEAVRLEGEKEAARSRLNALVGRPADAPLAEPVRVRPMPATEPVLAALADRARAANPTLSVFALEDQEGRLFKPLAYTKTFAMAGGAILSITLVPVLMLFFVPGNIIPEAKNPINRALIWIYRPVIHLVLRIPMLTVIAAIAVLGATVWPASQLGSEFMPSLNEGTLMFMPVTLPGLSVTKAAELLQTQDRIIKSFPEVASVFGKAGRAMTATDPAPVEMSETIVNLKPPSEWPAGMTVEQLTAEMNAALQLPGVSNAWTMPIKARIDMLSTGIRTPVGVKVFGPDLQELDRLATDVVKVVHDVPGTTSAFAERQEGGHYIEIEPNREAAARYGLSVDDIQKVVASALGGETVTTTVEGRERYGVNVRYPRGLRDRQPGPGPDNERRDGSARPDRQRARHHGSAQYPYRERPARSLHLR
jgi:hypothetical protein